MRIIILRRQTKMEATIKEAVAVLEEHNIQSIAHCSIDGVHEYSLNIHKLRSMDPNKVLTIYQLEPHGLLAEDVFGKVRKAGKSALYQVRK